MEIGAKLMILLLAAAPVSELRGAIPYGICIAKLPVVDVFILALLGNLLPVVPLFFGIQFVLNRLNRFRHTKKFGFWIVETTKRRAAIVERYEAIGLALFIAIPLPMTGAWTGTIAASLFKIRFRYALLAVIVGVLIAGVIVTILTLGGSRLFYLLYPK